MSVRRKKSRFDSVEQLMGLQGERRQGRCAVCGAECDPAPVAILHGMPDKIYVDGRPARNPVFDMCPECASLHAERRLHLRWAETESTLAGRRLKGTGMEFVYIGGHWEWRVTDKPMPMEEAWFLKAKWSRIS